MAPRRSNEGALGWLVTRLRRQDALGDMGEVVVVLAAPSGRLVDAACAPDSDVPVDARAQAIRAHGVVLAELREILQPTERDAFRELQGRLSIPTSGERLDSDEG